MLIHEIALTLIPGVGTITAKKLLAYCGSAEAVFKENNPKLKKIPRMSEAIIHAIHTPGIFERAEKEALFIEKYQIKTMFFLDDDYPFRLKQCIDGPLMMYYKGNADLNAERILGIVGTRTPTEQGKEVCRLIVEGLSSFNVLVASGLAYGIDSCSHKAALDNGLKTIGILGHGLDRIYPQQNRQLAERMVQNGGLLTEFTTKNKPDRENFPMRNRIIAGISDAILVVEAALKGGALITAEIADSYDRDVFAVPGRISDTYSAGCNMLIKKNKAAMIESAEDIIYLMGWEEKNKNKKSIQKKLFYEFTPDEESIVNYLKTNMEVSVDILCSETGMNMSRLAAALLNLELEGVIITLPGKIYRLAL